MFHCGKGEKRIGCSNIVLPDTMQDGYKNKLSFDVHMSEVYI